jgi:hypothetical protein
MPPEEYLELYREPLLLVLGLPGGAPLGAGLDEQPWLVSPTTQIPALPPVVKPEPYVLDRLYPGICVVGETNHGCSSRPAQGLQDKGDLDLLLEGNLVL